VPILVRPVREQIEHDRVIRQLQTKWRRKYRADINPGDERTAGVQVGTAQLYPDLILTTEGQKKPSAVVEVETGESVNHLEAMSQWASFARSRIPFYLFVPAGSLDSARRLVADHQIGLTELWTYFVIGEQIRFTPVVRSAGAASDSITEKVTEQVAEKTPAPPPETVAAKVAAKVPAKVAAAAAAAVPEPVAVKVQKPLAIKVEKIAKVEKVEKERAGKREPVRERDRARAPEPKRRVAAARTPTPPRRKAAAPTKRAVAPKRGNGRTVTAKRAVAAKRPARSAAKRAPATATAGRRPAKTARPAAKRARAQKRK
jgi:hypothetical protein